MKETVFVIEAKYITEYMNWMLNNNVSYAVGKVFEKIIEKNLVNIENMEGDKGGLPHG